MDSFLRSLSFAPRERKRANTSFFFSDVSTAPAVGGLEIKSPHSKYLLTPEVLLFEPTEHEIHRGGAPAPPGKPGTRIIFVNTPLTDLEIAGLEELHQAYEKEGGIPGYVRVHALRIVQQAKFNMAKAKHTIASHLEMRVQLMPISEESVVNDLKKGVMYWHGRDRKCRPMLIWKMSKINLLEPEAATRMILFILEYAVRYALVPGRVETWNVIVDLSDTGLSQAGSNGRAMLRNVTRLLEEVFCGRANCTKIFHLPWVIRAIVNSLIPEDKRSKVEFVADENISKVMRELCEPHQLEKQYGGTAPNLEPHECYPFKFFPNVCGADSGGSPPDESLHELVDRTFHEGYSWDTSRSAKKTWQEHSKSESLTPFSARFLSRLTSSKVEPCQDIERWKEIVMPEESRQASSGTIETKNETQELNSEPVSPGSVLNQDDATSLNDISPTEKSSKQNGAKSVSNLLSPEVKVPEAVAPDKIFASEEVRLNEDGLIAPPPQAIKLEGESVSQCTSCRIFC